MDAFLGCMAALGTADERLEGHRAAVCADSQLMGELAALTATMHANMPLCAHEGDAWRAERAMSDLLRWAASWNDLPWPGDNEPEQPAAVQVAAARILQGEARRLQQLALPETPKAVQRWQQAVAAIAPLSSLLLGPCCSASRQCQVVLALAEAGPAVARFFPAAAAVLGRSAAAAPTAAAAPPAQGSREAGGHAVGASRGGYAAADARLLQGTLFEWKFSLSGAMEDLCLPPPSSGQRQQLLVRLLALATSLAWLAGQMPQAVHALNGGSGPARPPDGCSCRVCREPDETPGCTSSAVLPPPAAWQLSPQPAAAANHEREDRASQQRARPSVSWRGRNLVVRVQDWPFSVPGMHELHAGSLISTLKSIYVLLDW